MEGCGNELRMLKRIQYRLKSSWPLVLVAFDVFIVAPVVYVLVSPGEAEGLISGIFLALLMGGGQSYIVFKYYRNPEFRARIKDELERLKSDLEIVE